MVNVTVRRNNPYINHAAARGGATAGSNVKGCLMALLLIAMFMVASLSSTTAPNEKKPLRSGQAAKSNVNKPALNEFDMDQVGWVRPSDDDAASSASSSKDNANDKPKNNNNNSADNNPSVSSSSSGDGMDYYDLDEFYRDADLLDAQAAVDEAADEFYSAMQDELLSNQKDIDDALKEKMTEMEKEAKELNDKQQPKFNDGEFKKLMDSIRNELRNTVTKKIEEMAMEMLEDINTDMEAAVDINEEYEQEGSGDPIDLEQEQEELTLQVIQLTREIVEEVMEIDLPELAFISLKNTIDKQLKDKFKEKKFVIDVNVKDWKVKGWRDVTPTKPPTPAPTQPPTNKPTEAPKVEERVVEKGDDSNAGTPEDDNKVEEEKEKEEAGETEGQ